jgi:hypothetical protein
VILRIYPEARLLYDGDHFASRIHGLIPLINESPVSSPQVESHVPSNDMDADTNDKPVYTQLTSSVRVKKDEPVLTVPEVEMKDLSSSELMSSNDLTSPGSKFDERPTTAKSVQSQMEDRSKLSSGAPISKPVTSSAPAEAVGIPLTACLVLRNLVRLDKDYIRPVEGELVELMCSSKSIARFVGWILKEAA